MIKFIEKKQTGLVIIAVMFFSVQICFAQKGKNGAETISANNTIVNEYTALTADAAAGNTSITVTDNTLNTNGRFTSSLSNGDLVMIIQMQGATINGTAIDSTWGAVTNYNNCGLFEFTQVSGITGTTTINVCPLKNNYTAAGKVQVIRVPRFTSLTINANDTLTCDTWDGTKGGMVVLEVAGNTTINGAISATGKGFRGGALDNSVGNYPTTSYVDNDVDNGAEKGESIAGYETDYNVYGGMYCRGAAANGGGGGDGHNAAGGGGSNAGTLTAWTGNGNPDITTSVNYASAWNLEYNGFASSTSSGGGRGGYTWCTSYNNPYTTPPGNFAWGGDDRRNAGGLGGRPLDYSTGRIFDGGGGGAGQEDNNSGGAGGNGGGIIYELSYSKISGNGSVLSNGANGQSAYCFSGAGDPPGGGGGGGTIELNSAGTINGITLYADGGVGGNQVITVTGSQPDESEGAAGGGGGGYIATSNGGLTMQVVGGVNGISNSPGITPFLPNGGTVGGAGITDSTAIFCLSQLGAINGPAIVCPGETYKYSVASGCVTTLYSWTLPTGWSGTSTSDTINVVAGASGGVITASICPFDTTMNVTIYPEPTPANLPKDTLVCENFNLQLNAGSTTFQYMWSTGDTTPVINVTDTGTYWVRVSSPCDTLQNDSIVIIQKPLPNVSLGNDTTVCDFNNFILTAKADTSVHTYLWSTGSTTSSIVVTGPGVYKVTVSNSCGSVTDSITISSCLGGYTVPNAFTPGNGGGLNSLFALIKYGTGKVTLMRFSIYNRWGQLVFTTNDDQDKWDGRFNGHPEPIDVYVYYVEYINSLGGNVLLKGNVTLLR